MANLKQDLDEYLLLKSEQKKIFNGSKLRFPNTFQWFRREESDNSWLQDTNQINSFKLTRLQRILGFLLFIGLGLLCMILSTVYIPVLVLKARKFALLYSMGSLFFILSFSFLSGFRTMFKQMLTKERMFVSIGYVISLFGTLYFAIIIKSTPITICTAVLQGIFLLLMLLSCMPGGSTGLRFVSQIFKSSVSSTLPV